MKNSYEIRIKGQKHKFTSLKKAFTNFQLLIKKEVLERDKCLIRLYKINQGKATLLDDIVIN